MATITILDTGYIVPSNTGTRLTSAYMTNTGLPIELKGITFTVSTKTTHDANPLLNAFKPSEVNVGSLENDVISIVGVINMDNAIDTALMYQLSRLPKTIGYKTIYYNSVDEADEVDKQLVTMMSGGHTFSNAVSTYQSINEVSTFSLASQFKCIHVRFDSFSVSQSAGSAMIQYQLQAIKLPNEDPTEIQ